MITTNFNTNVAGKYTVGVTADDSTGNRDTKSYTILVEKTSSPDEDNEPGSGNTSNGDDLSNIGIIPSTPEGTNVATGDNIFTCRCNLCL